LCVAFLFYRVTLGIPCLLWLSNCSITGWPWRNCRISCCWIPPWY